MADKSIIILYADSLKANLGVLDNEQAGELLRSIVSYVSGDEYTISSPLVSLAFNNVKLDIDRCNDKYKERCEKNRENVRKRWEKQYDRINRNTIEYESIPNNNDNKNDNDILSPTIVVDNNKENITKETPVVDAEYVEDSPKRKTKQFVKPSQDEVVEYFFNQLHAPDNIEAAKFFSYYESNGWMVGKNKMKNWHSAASGWYLRSQSNSKNYGTTKYERAVANQQQLQQGLAEHYAAKCAAESARENQFDNPALRRYK